MSGYTNPYDRGAYGDDDDDDYQRCAICDRETDEICGQCGTPLCPTCFSAGGGFCLRPCPTTSYRSNSN